MSLHWTAPRRIGVRPIPLRHLPDSGYSIPDAPAGARPEQSGTFVDTVCKAVIIAGVIVSFAVVVAM